MVIRYIGCATAMILWASSVSAQVPEAPKEMEVYQHDVGDWDCDIKMWADPSGDPMASKGTESNHMLGGMWLVSHFKADMGGMPFEGSGQFGYDAAKKKYIGAWVDSMSPYAMHMEGTWDPATKTMTQFGTGKGPDGSDMKTKSTVVYKDGVRVFTMYGQGPGGKDDWQKMMEVTYRKAAKPAVSK